MRGTRKTIGTGDGATKGKATGCLPATSHLYERLVEATIAPFSGNEKPTLSPHPPGHRWRAGWGSSWGRWPRPLRSPDPPVRARQTRSRTGPHARRLTPPPPHRPPPLPAWWGSGPRRGTGSCTSPSPHRTQSLRSPPHRGTPPWRCRTAGNAPEEAGRRTRDGFARAPPATWQRRFPSRDAVPVGVAAWGGERALRPLTHCPRATPGGWGDGTAWFVRSFALGRRESASWWRSMGCGRGVSLTWFVKRALRRSVKRPRFPLVPVCSSLLSSAVRLKVRLSLQMHG